MSSPINFPFHRDREHLPAKDRQQISTRKKTKPARAECGIGIVPWRRWNYRARNLRPLTDRRFVFVRHARALEYAHEIVATGVSPAIRLYHCQMTNSRTSS